MRRVRGELNQRLPQPTTYFQSGGLVDAVLNLGLPGPIDVQASYLLAQIALGYTIAPR